jgi:hypothetical protein
LGRIHMDCLQTESRFGCPKPVDERSDHDLFRTELVNLIDQRQELARLGELIDWQAFAQQWGLQFESTTGRPALPTRLMAALLYLKHVYALSDEDVIERWVENPYWQHFSGERYFRHDLPCDRSSLVRWRKRIALESCPNRRRTRWLSRLQQELGRPALRLFPRGSRPSMQAIRVTPARLCKHISSSS